MRVLHGMRPPEKYAPMLTVLLALQFGAERSSVFQYGTANPSTLATMIPELPGTAVHLGGLNNSQVCEAS